MITFQKFKNSLSIFRRITFTKQNKKLVSTNFMIDGTDIKWEDTVKFTLPINGGRVIKVYNANTIIIASKLPYNESQIYRLSVRLQNIITPEMNGKYVTDEEKKAAKAAHDFVSNLVLNKYVKLKNISNEKYDCVLADVYIGDIYLNDLLVKEQYAVKYYDGIKIKPTSWLMYKLIGEI